MTSGEYDGLKRFIEDYEPNKENTMKETKTCPFCGHLPIVGKDSKDYWNITCETVDCPGENDLWWETYDDAVKAWNTRYEPTCAFIKVGNDYDEIYAQVYKCSNCGAQNIGMALFCPNCGKEIRW